MCRPVCLPLAFIRDNESGVEVPLLIQFYHLLRKQILNNTVGVSVGVLIYIYIYSLISSFY
jgi:hypothetical protein